MAKKHVTQKSVPVLIAPEDKAKVVRSYMRSGMQDMGLQHKLNFLYQLASIALMDCKSEFEMQDIITQIRADVLREENEDARKPVEGVR